MRVALVLTGGSAYDRQVSARSGLWLSRLHSKDAASRRAAIRDNGTHTMRRTKATLIYRRPKNLRAVQLLLGHSKLKSTVRYLGIEVNDAFDMAEQTEV